MIGPWRETHALLGSAYVFGLIMLMTAGIYDGPLAEPSLFLAAACLALFGYLFWRLLRRSELVPAPPTRLLLVMPVALSVFCVMAFVDRRLLGDAPHQSTVIRAMQIFQIVLLATYLPSILGRHEDGSRWRNIRFTLFGLAIVAGSIDAMSLSPNPVVDLYAVHDQGAKALLRGENPYVAVHVEETTEEKHIVGFVYPPTPCYLNTIAFALGRDVRWGTLAALLLAGTAMREVARGRNRGTQGKGKLPALLEDAPALFLWLSPKTLFMIEQSWNDIYPIALLSLGLAAHFFERRYAAAALLGLALSAKQTMIWFAPLAFLLEFTLAEWALFLGVAVATALPFLLLDFFAMKRWLVDMYVKYPPKTGTLSAANFFYRHFGLTPRSTPGLLFAAITSVIAAKYAPRTRYAFALSATLVIFLFYFFNIWMCMNYYYFIAGAMLNAAAFTLGEGRQANGAPA